MGLLGDSFACGDSRTTTILPVVRSRCYVSNGRPFRVLLFNINMLVVPTWVSSLNVKRWKCRYEEEGAAEGDATLRVGFTI